MNGFRNDYMEKKGLGVGMALYTPCPNGTELARADSRHVR